MTVQKQSTPPEADKPEARPTPVRPVDKRIGEGEDNLRGRAEQFQKRRTVVPAPVDKE
jgi:hypothetical protein